MCEISACTAGHVGIVTVLLKEGEHYEVLHNETNCIRHRSNGY